MVHPEQANNAAESVEAQNNLSSEENVKTVNQQETQEIKEKHEIVKTQGVASDKDDYEEVFFLVFQNGNRFGICPADITKNLIYRKDREEIDEYGKNAPILQTMPALFSYAITLRGERFVRCKIIKILNSNDFLVEMFDYGNIFKRKLSDLRVISQKIMNLPIYTEIVEVNKVQKLWLNHMERQLLKPYRKKFYKIKRLPKLHENQFYQLVDFYDIETGEYINEKFVKMWSNIQIGNELAEARNNCL